MYWKLWHPIKAKYSWLSMNDQIDIRKIDAHDQSSKQERVLYFYLFYFILIRNLASNLSFIYVESRQIERDSLRNWEQYSRNFFYFYLHIIDHCNAKYIDDRCIIEKINFYKTVIGVLVNTNDTGPIISMYRWKPFQNTCRLAYCELHVNQF